MEHLQLGLDDVPSNTADSLAQSNGVSRATVVRFARRIGYARFTELQLASRHALLRTSRDLPLSRYTPAHSGSLLEQKAISGQPQRARHTSADERTDAAGGEIDRRDPSGGDSIRHAARLIAQQHRNRLPFVDDDGHLLEVVTRVDALQALAR